MLENAYRTIETCGELMSASDVAGDAVDFPFDTGLYVQLPAHGAEGVTLACARGAGRRRRLRRRHASSSTSG